MQTTQLSEKEAAKFLYRTTFGPRPGDVETLLNMGVKEWLDDQFSKSVRRHLPLLVEYAAQDKQEPPLEAQRMDAWWARTIKTSDPLRQRIAFAMSQIWVVSVDNGNNATGLAHYYDTLLKHAFGNVRDLLLEISESPVMGKYLTYAGSKKYNPNNNTFPDENYAREIMQLFTVGLWKLQANGMPLLDSQGNKQPVYTQNDIEELAKVFTGWNVNGGDFTKPMVANDGDHDKEEKTVLGEVFVAGQSAKEDMSQAIDLLFNHANTPMFLSTLLIKRLTISNPRRNYIERVANVFKDNGYGERGDMKAILKAIFLDEDVLSGQAMMDHQHTGSSTRNFGKVKEPLIAMANFARALDVKSNASDRWYDFPGMRAQLGQAPLCSPSVFNFYEPDYAPNGEISDLNLTAPEFGILGMDNMRRIHNRMWQLCCAWQNSNEKGWSWNESSFMRNITDVEAFMDLLNEKMFAGLMRADTRRALENVFLSYNDNQTTRRLNDVLFVAQSSPDFRCQE